MFTKFHNLLPETGVTKNIYALLNISNNVSVYNFITILKYYFILMFVHHLMFIFYPPPPLLHCEDNFVSSCYNEIDEKSK